MGLGPLGRGHPGCFYYLGIWRGVLRGAGSQSSEEGGTVQPLLSFPREDQQPGSGSRQTSQKLEPTPALGRRCCLGILLTGITSGKSKRLLFPIFSSLSMCPLLTVFTRLPTGEEVFAESQSQHRKVWSWETVD